MLKFILSNPLLIIFCVCATDVSASVFLLESEVNARVTYDDNVNTSTIDTVSSSFYSVTPAMQLNYISDSWETAMDGNVSGTTYSDEFQNKIDSHIGFETAYKDNLNIYSISTGYDKFSNRAQDENITGQTLEQTDTSTFMLAPKYTRLLTERVSLSLDYSYSDVKYDPNSIGRYLPYETQTATGLMAYKLSQKSELSIALAAIDYISENNISEYQLLVSKLGFSHNFSKMIAAKFFVGANTRDFITRSSQDFVFFGSTVTGTQAVETSSTGGTFEASIDAKWIELSISRDTVSNFTGGLDQTDKIHIKLRMQVTPIIGIALSLDSVSIDEINDNVLDYSQTYTKVIPAMNFSLSRNLSFRAEYIYIEQEYVSLSPGISETNRFAINMKYNFPSI